MDGVITSKKASPRKGIPLGKKLNAPGSIYHGRIAGRLKEKDIVRVVRNQIGLIRIFIEPNPPAEVLNRYLELSKPRRDALEARRLARVKEMMGLEF